MGNDFLMKISPKCLKDLKRLSYNHPIKIASCKYFKVKVTIKTAVIGANMCWQNVYNQNIQGSVAIWVKKLPVGNQKIDKFFGVCKKLWIYSLTLQKNKFGDFSAKLETF